LRATRPRAASPAKPAPVVVRLHEATGSARTGWDAAVKAAVKAARGDVGDPIAVEIARQWADLGPKGITTYHVNVKVAYRQPLAAPKHEAVARRERQKKAG
jgi:flavin-binding protein dodecin